MGEEIAFENGGISDFQGLMTLTLDRVILHTVIRHSLTFIYIPNFVEIEESFCGRTGGRTFETHFIRLIRRSRPKKAIMSSQSDLSSGRIMRILSSLAVLRLMISSCQFSEK